MSRAHFNPLEDGRDDLLVIEQGGASWAWVADGESYEPFLLAEEATSAAVGDYWAEGVDRVVLRTPDGIASLRFEHGWLPAEPLPFTLGPGSLFGGRSLLAARNGEGLTTWRSNNQLESILLPDHVVDFLVLDADGDGDEDLLVIRASGPAIVMFTGPEAWECWAPVDGFSIPSPPSDFVAGDLDGDGADEFMFTVHSLSRHRLTYP
ncbi:MAG: VCBS repeat-containing protein [Myxococcales bacterium]|nr:VCBS repeat-containing protein [Myxococcales bacterium]